MGAVVSIPREEVSGPRAPPRAEVGLPVRRSLGRQRGVSLPTLKPPETLKHRERWHLMPLEMSQTENRDGP